jgi:hypothetical protein
MNIRLKNPSNLRKEFFNIRSDHPKLQSRSFSLHTVSLRQVETLYLYISLLYYRWKHWCYDLINSLRSAYICIYVYVWQMYLLLQWQELHSRYRTSKILLNLICDGICTSLHSHNLILSKDFAYLAIAFLHTTDMFVHQYSKILLPKHTLQIASMEF